MPRWHHLAALLPLALGPVLPLAPVRADVPTHTATLPQNAVPLAVTGPGIQGQQTFQQPNESQWFKIRLKKGQDYAFYSAFYSQDLPYFPTVSVHNSNGKRLARFSMSNGLDGWYDGIEFRAPYNRTFYIKAKNTGPVFPVPYVLEAELDCRAGATTKCKLAVGQTAGGTFNYSGDVDWRRVAAQAGRTYTVSMMVSVSGYLSVRNRGGREVASCDDTCQVRFKAAYTGPYYVLAIPADEDSGGYGVGLTVP